MSRDRRLPVGVLTRVALLMLVASTPQTAQAQPNKVAVQDWRTVIPSNMAKDFPWAYLPLGRTLRALDEVRCFRVDKGTEGIYHPRPRAGLARLLESQWAELFDPDDLPVLPDHAGYTEAALRTYRELQKKRADILSRRITIYRVWPGCCDPCLHKLTYEKGRYDIDTTSHRLNIWARIAGAPSYDSVDDVLDDIDDMVNWAFDPCGGGKGRQFWPEVTICSWHQETEWNYDANGRCAKHRAPSCSTQVLVGKAEFDLRGRVFIALGPDPPHFPWLSGEEGVVCRQKGLGKSVSDLGYPVGRLANWFKISNAKISKKWCVGCEQDETAMYFIPNGSNYGAIGTIYAVNVGAEEQTCTMPDGTWLASNDDQCQDMVVTDVPTRQDRTPCGAEALDVTFAVPPETVVALIDVPGVCPDFEEAPPAPGGEATYEVQPVNETSTTICAVVDTVAAIDFAQKPFQGMTAEQAQETACQAAVWYVESRVDEVDGNEVTSEALQERFFTTYLEATVEAREEMDPEQREEMDEVVRADIEAVISIVDFVAKDHAGNRSL